MEMTMRQLDGDDAREVVAKLKPIYFDSYSDPPYEYSESDSDEFVERFLGQSSRPAFRLILGEVGDEIAGFAYGYIFPQDIWWRGAKSDPPPDVAAGTRYAVIELVVNRPYRGHGFSRRLLDALVAGRTEDFAILLAKPGSQAHAMYQRWGWKKVGVVQSYPHWPVDDALVLPLRDNNQSTT